MTTHDVVVAGAAAPVPEGAGDVAEGDRYCGNLDRAVPEMDYLRKSGMFRVIVSVVSVGRAALVIDDTRPGADRVIREFRYGSAVARP